MITATGGTWDRARRPLYFLAGACSRVHLGSGIKGPFCNDVLLAIDQLKSPADVRRLTDILDGGCNLLIDSGCFNLANAHAARHGMEVIEALALPPAQLEGFEALFDRYVALVSEFGARSWGYIEIDIGGRDNKCRTRAKLEAMGLRPIPVYHPFSDGWDYFDYLAQRYDRICLANLGTAASGVRKRLVATAWERRRRYPDLWIHALGATPSPMLAAFPMDSCDSSAWLGGARWGTLHAWAALRTLWPAERGWLYIRGAGPAEAESTDTAYRLLGFDAGMMGQVMRTMLQEQERVLEVDWRMSC